MKRFVQYVRAVSRDAVGGYLRHDCALRAAGLTYFTILSLVPLLCLCFLLARPLGVDAWARAKMNDALDAFIVSVEKGPDLVAAVAPADPAAQARKREAALVVTGRMRAVAENFFAFFARVDYGTFGWIGLATLLWTVVSTLATVERSFNVVWGVERNRPFWKRCWLYALASVVLPVLVAAALSMPVLSVVQRILSAATSVTPQTKAFGDFLVGLLASKALGWCVTLFFASCAFAFFFAFLPNCPVSPRAAAEGGFATAVAFAAWLKICAVAQVGVLGASKLYGAFAVLPISLAWSYVGWQIVLFGATFTHALQNLHGRPCDGAVA